MASWQRVRVKLVRGISTVRRMGMLHRALTYHRAGGRLLASLLGIGFYDPTAIHFVCMLFGRFGSGEIDTRHGAVLLMKPWEYG